jgi:hypothetical protein
VLEEDETWDFDSLLQTVFQDIQKELDDKENQDENNELIVAVP